MRRTGGATWRSGRRGIKVAALAAVLAATALAAGAGPTAAQQVIAPRLAYTCAFPSGTQQVAVQIAATFPDGATAGQPIQPTGTAITMTIPHPAITDLLRAHASAVTALASLTTTVADHGVTADATWTGLKAHPTPLPAKGPLALTASGTAPSTTVAAPGTVTFTAAALSILLLPHKADGSATATSAMPAECALSSGQDALLASLPVTGGSRASGHTGPISVTPKATGSRPGMQAPRQGKSGCPPLPPGGLKLNPRFPPPTPPKGSTVLKAPPLAGCAFVIGFSDVRKLNGAALIGPGLTNLDVELKVIENQKVNYLQLDNAGQLEFHGLHQFPPATSTLLAFGFMPVTATLQLSEIGTLNAFAVGPASPIGCGKCITTTTIYSLLSLRIYDIKVNGVPLNAGNGCRTVNPFEVVVKGTSPQYNIATGGPLAGTITVPDFTGCGVGENLDPIFNASISGPGNFVQLTQGTLCTPNSGSGCPPTVPTPQR